jgi:predicted O-methyltransferase YrrM
MRVPWLTYKAIAWLENYLNNDMTVFEWGSGDSTFFLAERVRLVISVEHDKEWHGSMVHNLEKEGIENVISLLFAPGTTREEGYTQDSFTSKTFKKNKGKYFKNYVSSVEVYNDEYFDLVMVDGRSRASCIKKAIPKIKKGGYLLLDNCGRKHYECGIKLLSPYERTELNGEGATGEHWKTSVWRIN